MFRRRGLSNLTVFPANVGVVECVSGCAVFVQTMMTTDRQKLQGRVPL